MYRPIDSSYLGLQLLIECGPCNGIPFAVSRLHRVVAWQRRAQLNSNTKTNKHLNNKFLKLNFLPKQNSNKVFIVNCDSNFPVFSWCFWFSVNWWTVSLGYPLFESDQWSDALRQKQAFYTQFVRLKKCFIKFWYRLEYHANDLQLQQKYRMMFRTSTFWFEVTQKNLFSNNARV